MRLPIISNQKRLVAACITPNHCICIRTLCAWALSPVIFQWRNVWRRKYWRCRCIRVLHRTTLITSLKPYRPMPDKLRVAVLGAGVMGKNHARIYHELPEAELVAIVDTHEQAGRALAELYGVHFYPTLNELPANAVDAVSVCTPTSTHHTVGLHCLNMGFHMLMEKRIAATVEQGAELLNRAREK